jgi:Zn-dependent protease
MLIYELISNGNLFVALSFIVAILFALTIHEYCHALAAVKLGDPTPKLAGRLTLNPIAHLDLIGTISLLLIGIGMGKPVPINSSNLLHPQRDEALISLAGPGANFASAIFFGLILHFLTIYNVVNPYAITLLFYLVFLSLLFGIFNLIPIPPLDGSHVLFAFLSPQTAAELQSLGPWIFIGLIFLIFFTNVFSSTIIPLVEIIFRLIVRFPIGYFQQLL